jgi:glycosyltransferase involved in cell wall biosynthesis
LSHQFRQPGLSVVVTVYTETVSVIETVERLLSSDTDGVLREIILVIAPKASAETKEICQELTQRFDIVKAHIQQSGPGVGRALREGMLMACEERVAIMSGDLETEPEAVSRMYRKMQETGADVVVGSRWLKGGGFHNYDRIKLVCNWMFQKIFGAIYRTRINDLTYGFKLLHSKVIRSIDWESTHHTIFIETTVKPLLMGYRVEQVPTVWIGRREGESVNTFFRNFEYVKLALRVKRDFIREPMASNAGLDS